MGQQPTPVCAAIDVGSNTIHVVVARCFPSTLEILADELEIVRIGESVTASGEISPAKCQMALDVLKAYKTLAEQHQAQCILVVATEALRQASNSAVFIALVKAETGLDIQVISGMAEAALTFSGAMYEAGQCAHVGVLDLGGGSLELVWARDRHITWRTSVPLGSGWLHDHYLSGNPPASDEIKVAESFLKSYLRKLRLTDIPPLLIVTGGSANSLLYLTQRAFHAPLESKQLSQELLLRCQKLLSVLRAEDISNFYGQPLARTKVLLAGTLIIRHVMRLLQLQEITVSQHGIREGVLLAYARYGDNWLDEANREEQAQETFAQSAQRVLLERLHTMLDWREEVMKDEDVEAVHKMRVASRRMRSALDAYKTCCNPRLFAKIYRQVKHTARILGEARDTDVTLHYLNEQLEYLNEDEQTGIHWLATRLQTYRQQQQQKLNKLLQDLDGEKLERQLKACVRERMSN